MGSLFKADYFMEVLNKMEELTGALISLIHVLDYFIHNFSFNLL